MPSLQQLEQALVQSLTHNFGDLRWTMIDMLRVAVTSNGANAAIMEPDRPSLSYNDLLGFVEETVKTLNGMGFQRISRIALVLPTAPESAVAYLSVMCGMTAIALAPVAAADEYERYIKHSQAEAIIVQQGLPTAARQVAATLGIRVIEIEPLLDGPTGRFRIIGAPAIPVAAPQFAMPEDTMIVAPTSGTTSLPKFVPWTQRDGAVATYTFLLPILNAAGPILNMLPLHLGAGAVAIVSAIAAKKGYACVRGFDVAHIYRYLATYQPESLFVVPAILQQLVAEAPHYQEELKKQRIKLIYAGSATVSPQLLHDLQSTFGAAVNIGYGMTETGPITSLLLASSDDKAYQAGSVGKPIAIAQLKIAADNGVTLPAGEIGEINVLSPLTIKGYENNPEANAEQFRDGWFRTGDAGYLDSEGYLYLTGRIKEVINRGGSKVSPIDIDAVLLRHPAVIDAAAFGFPHAALGEDVAAAVVLREAGTTERDLRQFIAQHLPLTKVPSRFVFVDEIPRTDLGKVKRTALTALFRSDLER